MLRNSKKYYIVGGIFVIVLILSILGMVNTNAIDGSANLAGLVGGVVGFGGAVYCFFNPDYLVSIFLGENHSKKRSYDDYNDDFDEFDYLYDDDFDDDGDD